MIFGCFSASLTLKTHELIVFCSCGKWTLQFWLGPDLPHVVRLKRKHIYYRLNAYLYEHWIPYFISVPPQWIKNCYFKILYVSCTSRKFCIVIVSYIFIMSIYYGGFWQILSIIIVCVLTMSCVDKCLCIVLSFSIW